MPRHRFIDVASLLSAVGVLTRGLADERLGNPQGIQGLLVADGRSTGELGVSKSVERDI